jgi:hypothetical protein
MTAPHDIHARMARAGNTLAGWAVLAAVLTLACPVVCRAIHPAPLAGFALCGAPR